MLSIPAMRTTSSTRSAEPWISGLHDGGVTSERIAVTDEDAAQRFEDGLDLACAGTLMPPSFSTRPRSNTIALRVSGTLPATVAFDGLPPATFMIICVARSRPGRHPLRVDATFEAIARVGHETGLAARGRRTQRIEIGALDEHVDGVVSRARGFSADNATEAERPSVVGDDAHGLVDGVLVAIEGQ